MHVLRFRRGHSRRSSSRPPCDKLWEQRQSMRARRLLLAVVDMANGSRGGPAMRALGKPKQKYRCGVKPKSKGDNGEVSKSCLRCVAETHMNGRRVRPKRRIRTTNIKKKKFHAHIYLVVVKQFRRAIVEVVFVLPSSTRHGARGYIQRAI